MNRKAVSVALSIVLVVGLLPIVPQYSSAFEVDESNLLGEVSDVSADESEATADDPQEAALTDSGEAADAGAQAVETTASEAAGTPANEPADEPEEATQATVFYGEAGGVRVEARAEAGAFPEGTEMRVATVTQEEVLTALADDIAADETIVDIAAVDITFEFEGQEVQPSDPAAVHVSLSTKEAIEGENLSVYHIDDEGQAEEVKDADIESTGAEFDSLGFSIYAVIGTDGKQDGDTVRRIYHFMQWDYSASNWKEIESQVQILKNGDKLVEPNEPASTFGGSDDAADDAQFAGWYVTGNEPANQGQDVSSGTKLEYKEVTDIDESANEDEVVYVYADFKVAYKAAFFDQNPTNATGNVGIIDVLVSTDGDDIDVSLMTELVATQEGKAVSKWYLRDRDGNQISGYSDTIPADDKTTLKFSKLKQTVFLYPEIENAVTVSFDKNDNTTNPNADPDEKSSATFTKSVKVAPGLKINEPERPTREGYDFGGWYTNGECTGSAVDFTTTTFSVDTTLYAKWEPKEVKFRVILWEETVDEEYGKEFGDKHYKYVDTYTDTLNAGTAVTWDLAYTNFYTHYTTSQIRSMFPYHVYPASEGDIDGEKYIAGDGSSIFNIYFDLKEYKLTFNVNYGSRQGTISIDGDEYHGSQYSFTAKMGEEIANKWPDAGKVSDITSGRTTYQFKGWTRSGSSTLYVTSRDELVPELLNTSGGNYVDTTYTASYGTDLSRAYIRYYLQTPNGSGYELSSKYSQYANTTSRSNWQYKEIDGFTYYRAPSNNGQYDSNLKAYVWSFYYNRNTYNMVFINYDEISKTTDRTRTGIAYGADISGEHYVPDKPESLKDKDYISFDGWYLDEYYQARFDENDSFTGKTMPNGNLTLYAKWKKGDVTITFDAGEGKIAEGGSEVAKAERVIEAESRLGNVPADPKWEGYEFLGWYDENGKAFDPKEPFTANTTFYAKWKSLEQFRVKYKVPDGDDGTAKEEGTARDDVYLYFDGAQTSVNKIANQKREGYNFVGWKFEKGDDTTIYHENEMITIDHELAVQEGNEKVIYLTAVYSTGVPIITKVTFDGNGGKTSGDETSIGKDATVDTYGNIQNNEWTTLAADTFTYEGYKFVEWNTKADGSGISFAPSKAVGADIIGESEIGYNTLYAIWERAEAEYTLNYYLERLPGETSQTGDIVIDGHYYGEVVYTTTYAAPVGNTVIIPPVPLTGAVANADDTKSYAASHGQTCTQYQGSWVVSDTVKADGSTTLNYFYSRNKYKVSYTYAGVIPSDANPLAANLPAEAEYVYGQQVPVIDDATANAYTFRGWHSSDVDGDIEKDGENTGKYKPFTMPAHDVEIFGLFTATEGGATAYIRYYVEIPNGGKVADTHGAIGLNADSVDLTNGDPDYTNEKQSYNFFVNNRYYQLPEGTNERQYELTYPTTAGATVQAPSLSFAGVQLDWAAVKASTDFTAKGTHSTNNDTVLSATVPDEGVTYVSLYYDLVENNVSYYYVNSEVPDGVSPAAGDLPQNEPHKYGDVVNFKNRGTAEGYSFRGWGTDTAITVIMEDGTTKNIRSGELVPADAVSYVMPNGPVNFLGQFFINKYKYKVLHYQEIQDQTSDDFDYESDAGTKYKLVETQTKDASGNDLAGFYDTEVTAAQRSYEGFSFNSAASTQKGKVKAYVNEEDMLTLVMLYDRTKYYEEHWLECLDQNNHDTDAKQVNGVWYVRDDREEKTGPAGKTVSTEPKDYAGFTLNETDSDKGGVIKGDLDDPLVLRNYYKRNTLTLSYAYAGTVPSEANPDASGLGNLTKEYKYGTEVAASDFASTSSINAAGYRFQGWFTDERCVKEADSFTIEQDTTLYGKFVPDSDIPYTVEFYYMSQGAYPSTATKFVTRNGETDSLVHIAVEDLFPDADHQNQDYEADTDNADMVMFGYVKADGSLKLKVYFKQDFTVNYLRGDYGAFTDINNLPDGDEHAADGKTHFPNTAYGTSMEGLRYDGEMDDNDNPLAKGDAEFLGWAANVDLDIDGETVAAGTLLSAADVAKVKVVKSFDLTAQWTPAYDITYTDNAGGKAFDDQTTNVREGKGVPAYVDVASGAAEPARAGYVFQDWVADVDVTDEDGNTTAAGEVLNNDDIAKLVVDEAITFSAQWKPCTPATGILGDPPVKKTVTGDSAPTDDTFTFTLSAVSNTGGIPVDEMPMPEGSDGSVKTTPALKAGEEYEFGNFEFAVPCTYVYQIAEVDEGKEGYTYDQGVYTVTYVVSQEGDKLTCVRTIAKDGEEAGNIATFAFTNAYSKSEDPVGPDDNNKPTPSNAGSKSETTARTADSVNMVPLLVLAALSAGLMI